MVDGPPRTALRRDDGGFTFIETAIVIGVLATLIGALGMAINLTARSAPASEQRIDDARSTRGLATWLSHDTTSTPPFDPPSSQGGLRTGAGIGSNECGVAGDNLLHLQWTEAATIERTFVANYRFVVEADGGRIVRFSCSRVGSGPYGDLEELRMTSGLDPEDPPVVTLEHDAGGDVSNVRFTLNGMNGETVQVDTSSRNPAEYFP